MNATKQELVREFNRAAKLGWLPLFIAAEEAITKGYFDAADLMGIGSRETNLDPKWLTKAGDGGNGFGLLQGDKRSFPDWIGTGQWKDAGKGIQMGAKVLMLKWHEIQDSGGNRVSVKSSKTGQSYSFIAKKVEGSEAQAVTIAAYNSGRWAQYAVSKGQDIDSYTTGKDYSSDVIARAKVFRDLLANYQPPQLHQFAAIEKPEQPSQSNEDTITIDTQSLPANPDASPESNAVPATPAAAGMSLKDFASKYLRHTPLDSVKNILAVIGVRALSSLTAVWNLGIHGKVLTVLSGLVLVAPALYALIYYRSRVVEWVKTIVDTFIENE